MKTFWSHLHAQAQGLMSAHGELSPAAAKALAETHPAGVIDTRTARANVVAVRSGGDASSALLNTRGCAVSASN